MTAAPGRLCACGCGTTIDELRPTARYATDACRTRAWKARTGYVDQRAAKPSRNATPRRKATQSNGLAATHKLVARTPFG